MTLECFVFAFLATFRYMKIPTACRQKAKRYLQAEFILVNPSLQDNCSNMTGFEGDWGYPALAFCAAQPDSWRLACRSATICRSPATSLPGFRVSHLAVPNILSAQVRAEAAGGEILRPAFQLNGVGKLSVVTDPTGAIIGLIETEAAALPLPGPMH